MAFELLRFGGAMVFDDYAWQFEPQGKQDPLNMPKPAIDAFVNLNMRRLTAMPFGDAHWQMLVLEASHDRAAQDLLRHPVEADSVKVMTCESLAEALIGCLFEGWTYVIKGYAGINPISNCRNFALAEFLASDCTDLVFVDDDVAWQRGALPRLAKHPVRPGARRLSVPRRPARLSGALPRQTPGRIHGRRSGDRAP